ncbi:NADH-quinone oxidoreductase subunit NuoN [Nocardioides bizhenqiangii]|uniref:NADH-quinone oxidoreductase subunit N n=1 Tax=Nocardioides bizhenqiangii TaxID=3095076 RepID=A0ABZ0ZRQ0_9ACTN|nr:MULTISPECIES: NADH-quinone oxidoreductase subunit NuoN [unclassified Nocardioides]MDZ5622746.1 NADH-quinone oxidoreductase subunit NuoN [Nocardioides sp. HM23]WQQ27009.1 NADH-quinone oxidoreductase subunit NuoN [Nocardioides sp. HM61]
MPEFSKPTLEYFELLPLFIVFGAACLGVLVEAFLPRERRRLPQVLLTLVALAAALGATIWIATDLEEHADGAARGLVGAEGSIIVDGPTVYLWGLLLVFGILGTGLFAERRLEGGLSAFAGQAAALPGTEAERLAATKGLDHTEVYPLLLFATGGMLMFPASGDLLTMFVALEVLSLPLYLLCGLARRRRLLSQEAALKYFLLGAFSSGFFLYGAALVYGYAGSVSLAGIDQAVRAGNADRGLLLAGIALLAVGLLFKVGAAPFQAWTPDVYQGAPTAVTAFMSAATKVAAFGALLRLFYVAFDAERWSWQPMLSVVAIATMLLGAVLAIVQTDVKRMLAYSAVAHTGFLLTGLIGAQGAGELAEGQYSSLEGVLFYLTTYGFASVGAFALVTVVRDAGGEASGMSAWAGLGKRSPLVAGSFAFFLLSMAGIPLTSGFVGKWAVFTSAMSAGFWWVVLPAIVSSVIAVFFYIRCIRVMFFNDPEPGETAAVTDASVLTVGTVAICLAATVVLGIVPGPVLDLVVGAGDFIR